MVKHIAANKQYVVVALANESNNYRERLFPFSGFSESGNGGRYNSKWHLELMTQTKVVMLNYIGQ
jgi:acyl-CoA reductase-like NAD-dependent aldehyde dehydrogenase